MNIREIIIGGFVPAVMLGVGNVLMKLSLKNGIALPTFLMVIGVAVFTYGLIAQLFSGPWELSSRSVFWAVAMAITWATATYSMSYGMDTLKLPVSIIAPLANSNAIVAVILGAIVFSEWKDLSFWKVGIGTAMIVWGATIVSTASSKG